MWEVLLSPAVAVPQTTKVRAITPCPPTLEGVEHGKED